MFMDTYLSKQAKNKHGLALIIAIIVSTVAFSVGLSLLDIALRQLSLSNINKDSEAAFHAAHAGIECIRLIDTDGAPPEFNSPSNTHYNPTTGCMGDTAVNTGATNNDVYGEGLKAEYHSDYDWAGLCTSVSVYKYYEASGADSDNRGPTRENEVSDLRNPLCPEDSTCTIIKSRGYSDICANINLPDTIEREVVSIY